MIDVWGCLTDHIKDTHQIDSGMSDTYTLPFPSSLSGPPNFKNKTFTSGKNCPATVLRTSRKATLDLVCSLVDNLNSSFSANIDPAFISVRDNDVCGAPAGKDTVSPVKSFVVFGSSHMRGVIPHIAAQGGTVADLTESSWVLNKNNSDNLAKTLGCVDHSPDTVYVLDLFGSTCTRFRQADDTLAPAVKLGHGGGWHMLGDVTGAPDGAVREQIRVLGPVLEVLKNKKKVIIPPIPRYVFGPCCETPEHAPNTRSTTHAKEALADHLRIRSTIKQALTELKESNYRITDVIGTLCGTNTAPADKLVKLKAVTARDNVHLLPAGYLALARSVMCDGQKAATKQSTVAKMDLSASQPPRSWKGFTTTSGIGKVSSLKYERRGFGRLHPYRRY